MLTMYKTIEPPLGRLHRLYLTLVASVTDDSANIKRTTKIWTLTQGQTILKSDQHIDLITNGQRATRHADRPYVFYFFANAHFLKTIFSLPHKWHIWFCPTHKPTLHKTKRAIFCQHTRTKKFIPLQTEKIWQDKFP